MDYCYVCENGAVFAWLYEAEEYSAAKGFITRPVPIANTRVRLELPPVDYWNNTVVLRLAKDIKYK